MKPDNWEKIEQIFSAAVALENPAEQRRFVENAARDEKLREEILKLLDNDRIDDDFLEEPFLFEEQTDLSRDESADYDGQQKFERRHFGQYYLLDIIGQGGMGVVYLAQDTRLNRKVALKVLPAELTGNQEMIARLRQEARAASQVAHPAVAHIYEFGNVEDRFYLTMEYASGQTLRALIKDSSTDWRRAVEIARQIAVGLEAAHAAGIVHRDIKPENIVVTDDGAVKILDFGLAKITVAEQKNSQNTSLETAPGLIMGTSAYMSPEQIRGGEIDAATDIWSLAVVLYETLTGERPFAGKTQSDTRAAILRDEPPLDKFAAPFREVFEKSLAKEKENRYATVADFRHALEKLAGSTEFLSSADVKPKRSPKKFNRAFVRYFLITAAIILPVALAAYFYLQNSGDAPENPGYRFARRLTGSGNAGYAAISPDGELTAYTLEARVGAEGLFLRSLKTGEEKTLIAPSALEFTGVAFSPDGQFIYYAVKSTDEIIASLYRLPASGAGEPQFILKDIDSPPGFSPDGKQIVYLRIDPDGKYEEIRIAEVENGGNARTFYRREMPDFIPHQAQPVWSPDGKKVILAAGASENGAKINQVIEVSVADGKAEVVKNTNFAQVSRTEWLKRENAFLMTARRDESEDARQIWRVGLPGGETLRLTNDLLDYGGISTDAAGAKIITLAGENAADLWFADLEKKDNRQITSGGNDSRGVAYAPDGRIVFSSNSTGRQQIFSANEDGGERRQLTNDEFTNTEPAVSPDGKLIAYISTRSGSRNIWLMDIDGANQRRLTNGTHESTPVFRKDGQAVIYFNYNSGAGALSQIALDGSGAQVLLKGTRRYPAVSPDGKSLLAAYRAPTDSINKLAIFSLENLSAAPRVFELLPGAASPGVVRWLPDGSGFCYIVTKSGASNLYRQKLDNTPPAKITDFADDRIYWFDIAPDGKRLVLARGSQKRFVTLLEKEKL